MEILNQAVLLPLVAVFALVVGSFLNVVIYRLPIILHNLYLSELEAGKEAAKEFTKELTKEDDIVGIDIATFSLSRPASSCPNCKVKLRYYNNIPVLSYLWLKGKCFNCNTHISLRYPLVECLTCVLALLIALKFGFSLQLFSIFLMFALVALTFIDLDTQLLPDNITLPMLWFGLALNSWGIFTSLEQAVWGAIGGYLSFWIIAFLFKLLVGKDGMGHGDFKLLAMLGAWLGAESLIYIVIISSTLGVIVSAGLLTAGKIAKGQYIPFGPYLCLAGMLSLLYKEQLIYFYHYLHLL